jgi:putative lipoprotein
VSEPDDRLVRRVVRAAGGRDAAEACPDAERLALYAERALEDDERPLVEAHVSACARCQAAITVFVRSAPEGVAAAPGWGTGAVEGTGAAEPRPTWWLGWKWLMPVAATAAVITLAVWVQRPGAPRVAVVEEQTPEATRMRQAEAGRPEAAAAASGSAAPRRSEAQTSKSASGAPTRGQASRAPADLAKAESLMRAELAATAPALAAEPAGVRPADTLADARERSVPATPAPAPDTQAQLRAAESEAATAQRPAESREANRADAAAPTRAKAVAGSEAAPAGAAGLGAAAVRSATQRPAQLTGRVTYRTRAALPAGAVIDVRLLDVSRMDAPAVVLGRAEIVTQGEQVPVPFVVGYDAAAIDERFRYTVQVTITIEGRVAYRTTTAHSVLTSGAPAANVEVVVEPMR